MQSVFVFEYSMSLEKLARVVFSLKERYPFKTLRIVVVRELTGVRYKLASFVDIAVDCHSRARNALSVQRSSDECITFLFSRIRWL